MNLGAFVVLQVVNAGSSFEIFGVLSVFSIASVLTRRKHEHS
jgi:hypothetical protein